MNGKDVALIWLMIIVVIAGVVGYYTGVNSEAIIITKTVTKNWMDIPKSVSTIELVEANSRIALLELKLEQVRLEAEIAKYNQTGVSP